jgi:hypothetical protein
MNKDLFKKLLPHLIAIIVFIVVSLLFCKPILEGNVLNQHDTVGWKGMAQNAFEYREKNGHFPLWNPNLFSGMPNYQVAMEGKSILPDTTKILSLGLPKPINFFFLGCLCFYILCLALGTKPVIGIMGGLAYSFATYNPVLVAAGHDTQMLATAFMPLLMAGLICTYEKKYWLGFALTTFSAYQQIAVNHLQVTYYFFLVAALVTIGYLIKWIIEKDWKHIGIAGIITVASAIIGIAGNALVLKTTSEYAAYTMRGGKDIEITGDSVKTIKTKGLDTAYAFEYSLGRGETVSMIMPNAFGGYSANRGDEKSNVVKELVAKGVNDANAEQVAMNLPEYWGKLFTSGPQYLGVLICLFGLLGFVMVKTPVRWGLLAATILGIFMTWGKYMPGFNTFLFENLPLYNKFRSPAFAQVIPQFTIGIIAALALQQIFFGKKLDPQDFKKILIAAGGLFVVLSGMYLMMDYNAPFDREISQNISQQAQNESIGRAVISGLKADRKDLFGGQLLRTLGLVLLALAVIYLYFKNKISSITAVVTLLVISTIEIVLTSNIYFSNDKGPKTGAQEQLFIPAGDYDNVNFGKTAIDEQLLSDKDPNFRVFNTLGTPTAGPFSESRTSYYHKSVGGYHPAKLRIYQDVIEKYFSGNLNQNVLDMLNTKYLVVQSPTSGADTLLYRPGAFGNCWLVKNISAVNDKAEAINAIGTVNLKETVIVEKSVLPNFTQPQWDSASSIRMTKFDNDAIEYEANCNGPQFAVFSEIYYPKGWNAYLDGKKTDYYNVNYVLRGMPVPAGKHTIKFAFEPASVASGNKIMFIASILILVVFLGGLYMAWRTQTKSS